MRESLLEHLVCPKDKSPLTLQARQQYADRIESGTLECTSCGMSYPIDKFVPRFLPDDEYVRSFSVEWTTFARTQLDSVSGVGISLDYFSRSTGLVPANLKGQLVLDAGCGTGRFLELFKNSGATIIGVDLSFAVDSAIENCANFENVHVVQADIFELPFRPETFDYVFSIGVLHHTPDPSRAFGELTRLVKPSGQMAVRVLGKRAIGNVNVDFLFPVYLFRMITKRVAPHRLLKFLRWYVPIACQLRRIPIIGVFFRWLFSVADYKGSLPLDDKRIAQWNLLDTFDRFSPWYYHRYSWKQVQDWFHRHGFVQVRAGEYNVSAQGQKPDA